MKKAPANGWKRLSVKPSNEYVNLLVKGIIENTRKRIRKYEHYYIPLYVLETAQNPFIYEEDGYGKKKKRKQKKL